MKEVIVNNPFVVGKYLSDKYLPTTNGLLIKNSSIPTSNFIANIIIIITIKQQIGQFLAIIMNLQRSDYQPNCKRNIAVYW